MYGTLQLYVYRYNTADVCVAVATEQGLITPIVFQADRKVSTIKYVSELICQKLTSFPETFPDVIWTTLDITRA